MAAEDYLPLDSYDDEDEDEDTTVTCRHCGKTGLAWSAGTNGKYELYEIATGRVHSHNNKVRLDLNTKL